MGLFSMLGRSLVLAASGAIPLMLVGGALARLPGVIAGAALWVLWLLYASFAAEAHLMTAFGARGRARAAPRTSAQRSLERVLAPLGGPAPRVVSLGDPSPQALVARSWGSHGTLLLSEGLLGALTEDELRRLLRAGVLRLRAPGTVLRTTCAWLAHLAFELAPRPWTELAFGELRWHESLGVLGAMRFAFFYAVARFFVRLGGSFSDPTASGEPPLLPHLEFIAGEVVNPGTCRLHFAPPWVGRSLFPL